MEDEILPKSVGEEILAPTPPTSKQEEVCKRLDDFHQHYGLKAKPSDMLRGAIFVSQQKLRSNPDWIAQAANSLREILYPFYSREVKSIPTNKQKTLKGYGSVKFSSDLVDKMGRMWGTLNGLAHHGNIDKNHVDFVNFSMDNFESLLADFENIMLDILARQVDLHKEIDDIILKGPV